MEKQLNGSTERSRSVPKLRFPEFKGEWEKKKLGDIFSISAGGDIEIEHVSLTKNDKFKYPIYANAEKGKGFYGWSDIYKVEENVLTVAGRGVNIGIAHARDHKFYPIVRLLVLKPKKKEDVNFFECQVNRLNLFKESTGVPQLTVPQVSGYEVVIPSLLEQSRIASFFSAIDEKLKLETQRMAALKQYKKGVMQKLFSQELRFKDENGEEFPEWEVKQIKNIFKVTRGNVLSMSLVSENQDSENKYSVYSSQTRNKGLAGYYKDFLFENAITWTTDGAGAGDVNFRKGKFYCTNVCGVLLSEDGYANLFIAELLNSISKKFVSYVGNPKLMNNIMSDIKISIPKSIPEQTKIANFLSAIDDKIDQAENRIQRIQMYKKGLLQQMFC